MKKKTYMISCILTAVLIFSTAAVCSLCSSLDGKVSAEGMLEKIGSSIQDNNNDSGKDLQDDSGNTSSGNSGTADGNNSGKNSSQGSNSSDDNSSSSSSGQDGSGNNNNGSNNSAKSGNNPPVINSISISSDTFLPGMTYKFTSDVTDPDNNTITYQWHIDSGSADTLESPVMNWTVPNIDGLYDVSLEVSDGWGGYDSKNLEIFVGKAASNPTTVITDIIISPSGGIYTGKTYTIWCGVNDNIGLASVDFSINGGVLHSQDANYIDWDTPGVPGTYKLNVTVTNKAGDKISGSKDFVVEQARVEISDLIVNIDYIEANASFFISAVVIDPNNEINSYEWSCSGGWIDDQSGYNAVWRTPDTPGTYSLTLVASKLSGGTLTRTEEFEVKPPK